MSETCVFLKNKIKRKYCTYTMSNIYKGQGAKTLKTGNNNNFPNNN